MSAALLAEPFVATGRGWEAVVSSNRIFLTVAGDLDVGDVIPQILAPLQRAHWLVQWLDTRLDGSDEYQLERF